MRGAVIVLIAACSARVPHGPPAAVVPTVSGLATYAIPGEFAEFVLSFRGFVVGRAAVDVGAPGRVDGHRVVVYRSHGQTEGLVTLVGEVRWELATTIDLDRAVAISDREDTFLGPPETVEHIVREHSERDDELQHDIQSMVAGIRGWRSKIGDRVKLDLVFASARLDVELWDAGRGFTPGRQVPAVRYEGLIDGETNFVAWMSDDADRVPLDVRIASRWGEISIELAEYRAPTQP